MKPYFLVTVSAAALTLGAGLLAKRRSRRVKAEGTTNEEHVLTFNRDARTITRGALQYFVVPLWLAAGLADWWCHRQTAIEETTGLKESLLHLLQMSEASAPILAGLLLEVDPLILSGMIAIFFLHEATAMWDVTYAVTAREVTPVEQHVHSFLEMVPLLAVSFVSLMHWPQFLALVGQRVEPDRPLRLKEEPVSIRYVVGALGAMIALEVLPYLEEAARDWRRHPGHLQPPAASQHPVPVNA